MTENYALVSKTELKNINFNNKGEDDDDWSETDNSTCGVEC